MIEEILVKDLKAQMDEGKSPYVLDVREEFEREICKLDGDHHISMNQIQQRYEELPKDKEIVVYCRSGQRSMQVAGFLREQGYTKVKNLSGGILAWSDYIDPTMPKY